MKTLLRVAAAAFVTALSVVLLASLASTARSQDAPGPEAPSEGQASLPPDTRPQVVPEAELKLHYYTPRHADARELAQVLSQIAGRMYYAQAADGSSTQPVSNVRTFGDVVVLYDRVRRVEELVTILAQLEEASREAVIETEQLVVAEYAPQYLSSAALMDALRPLRRQILQQSGGTASRGQGSWVDNVTGLAHPATIVLRDTPENVEEMLALMKRLDVPPPQVQLTCWLLRGSEHETGGRLPEELVQNLSRLVPMDHFEQLSMAMVRTSVQPGQEQRLRSDFQLGDDEHLFELDLIPAGFDRTEGVLPLSSCRFEASSGQEFSTSVTLVAGEYAVLGAAGADPLFVVLRLQPLDR